MTDPVEQIIFSEELDPQQREALQQQIQADPALQEVAAGWQRARSELRRKMEAVVPERKLLVLYALERDLLDPAEREMLDAARPVLDQAIREVPALEVVIRRIKEEQRDFEEVWEAQNAGMRLLGTAKRPAKKPAGRWVWRVAALLAFAVFAGAIYLIFQRDAGYSTIRTASGEMRVVPLADGSTVRLMENSTLSYRPRGYEGPYPRRARLEGQALFDVVPGDTRFIVETHEAVVTVLGTTFGVRSHDAQTEVILAAGEVVLHPSGAPDRAVPLGPGQMSRVPARGLPTSPEFVNLAEALEWTGLFFFRRASLEQIATRLGQFYGEEVAISPALAGEEVTGTFEQRQPISSILYAIAATLGARVEQTPEGQYRVVE